MLSINTPKPHGDLNGRNLSVIWVLMASKPAFKIAGWSVSSLLKQLNVVSIKTARDATPKNKSS